MSLVIKPLTPELEDAYFDFFENRAFTDDSPYRCYCQAFQMTPEQESAAYDSITDPVEIGRAARKAAQHQIRSGILRGYLAFEDGVCIGWCNANDRANYPGDSRTGGAFHAPAEKREKAVTCFEIAPEARGKGIATALLKRVLEDARSEGCTAVVSFPILRKERFEWDSYGPVHLYEKAGFILESEKDGSAVMKKVL